MTPLCQSILLVLLSFMRLMPSDFQKPFPAVALLVTCCLLVYFTCYLVQFTTLLVIRKWMWHSNKAVYCCSNRIFHSFYICSVAVSIDKLQTCFSSPVCPVAHWALLWFTCLEEMTEPVCRLMRHLMNRKKMPITLWGHATHLMWTLVAIFFACSKIQYYVVTDALRYDATF